ncbi:MAG: PaaI family thioesterase [Patescibacteria group bacterium]
MSTEIVIPSTPSPFGKTLRMDLGTFDSSADEYRVGFTPGKDLLTNLLRTVHGGALAGIFDEGSAMCIYFKYGINSAVTQQLCVEYHNPVRPGLPLTLVARIVKEEDSTIIVEATIYSGSRLIASCISHWQRRHLP